MITFLDLISLIGSAFTVAGVSLKDLRGKKSLAPTDQAQIESFLKSLEGRRVLFEGMDAEIRGAVISSLEEIKREVESLRVRCQDERVDTILLNLLLAMSQQLQKLHSVDDSTAQGQYKMYLALQSVRFELARVLALLCAAFGITPNKPHMKQFVLDFAVRPR